MNLRLAFFIILCACGVEAPVVRGSTLGAAAADSLDAGSIFAAAGFRGSAVLIRADGDVLSYGDSNQRFSPSSTFKIPHALAGLDAGVLEGPEHRLAWDGEERAFADWNRDHTLASAIEFSVVWYFQRVAPLVGRERFRSVLADFRYGNGVIGEDLTRFWLDDSLQISVVEQAMFWRRLHRHALPVSEEARASVLAMSVLAEDEESTLRGKTGWHPDVPIGGWFVGSLESMAGVTTFAVHLEADEAYDAAEFLSARRVVAEEILRSQGLRVPSPR